MRPGCVGVLLAGGAARRFAGMPKGLARLSGERIADRVLAALAAATDRQVVIANDPRASRWFPGYTVHPDREAGLGPLGGLEASLRAGDGAAVLVVAWDMPFVSGALLAGLRALGEQASASVIPFPGSLGFAEPLCAYYRADALGVVERLLAKGEHRASALGAALLADDRALMPGDEALRPFGEPARLFTSVDSPAALLALGGELPRTHGTR